MTPSLAASDRRARTRVFLPFLQLIILILLATAPTAHAADKEPVRKAEAVVEHRVPPTWRLADRWGPRNLSKRNLLPRPPDLSHTRWLDYRRGLAALPSRYLHRRERVPLTTTWVTLGFIAASPLTGSAVRTSTFMAGVWTLSIPVAAASFALPFVTTALHLSSAARLRRMHGIAIPTAPSIVSLTTTGVGIVLGLLFTPAYGLFAMVPIIAAGATVSVVCLLLQHSFLRRGWTLALERNPRLMNAPAGRPKLTVVPHIDPARGRFGVAGVW